MTFLTNRQLKQAVETEGGDRHLSSKQVSKEQHIPPHDMSKSRIRNYDLADSCGIRCDLIFPKCKYKTVFSNVPVKFLNLSIVPSLIHSSLKT